MDEVRCRVVGQLDTNCYAYVSEGECMVVDPGACGERLATWVMEDARPVLVVATHGHGDHVGGVKAFCKATGAPFAISGKDAGRAMRAGHLDELGLVFDDDAPAPDRTLADGDVLSVGSARFRVVETPGHSPGSIVLLGGQTARGICFVGDTLFRGSHGRCDLTGGDPAAMKRSLARLRELVSPDTHLLCGHGPATTMGDELRDNPYLQDSYLAQ